MPALTSDELVAHLWAAAEVLRGSMDAVSCQGYLMGLLILKRISDRFEEETDDLIKTGIPEQLAWADPDEHQFMVPLPARWRTIADVGAQLGDALNKACAALEQVNPALSGVLGRIDFNDAHKLGDVQQRDRILHRLISHFSVLSLRNANLADLTDPAEAGRMFGLLADRFARAVGKFSSHAYAPRQISQLIVEMLDLRPGMRICDPACGTGAMLIECAAQMARKYGHRFGVDLIDISLYGQEPNLEARAICRMSLVLAGLPNERIEAGDTLREPRLTERGELMLFDRVLTNPPFGLGDWGADRAARDPFRRFRYGLPPAGNGDYAFVQHVVATLTPRGMGALILPHGVLFRGSAEAAIRKALIDDDLLEAVIGLPANLFFSTTIPVAILIVNRAKPRARKDRVLFVDASAAFEADDHRKRMRPHDLSRIVDAFRDYRDVERFARVVTLAEISANDHNLTISRYVDTLEATLPMDIDGEIEALREIESTRDAAAVRMDELLRGLGHGT